MVFCVTFWNMYTGCVLRNKVEVFRVFRLTLFCTRVQIRFLRSDIKSILGFQFYGLRFKDQTNLFKVPKIYKNYQNHVPTKHGVIWLILKVIKIRDQVMRSQVIMLRF